MCDGVGEFNIIVDNELSTLGVSHSYFKYNIVKHVLFLRSFKLKIIE